METEKKVFCLGFSKTGTTSMEEALSILGYKVCQGHYNNSHTNYLIALYVGRAYDEIIRMTKYWDAFADGPWGGTDLYKVLTEKYPDAYYIQTTRDPEAWYASFEKMYMKFATHPKDAFDSFHANGRYGSPFFFKNIFSIETLEGNKQKIIDVFNRTNAEVNTFFSERPALKFLSVDVTKNSRWDEICAFLDKKIPQKSFPHNNIGVPPLQK